ncbi:hypothetical protein [Ruegeria sp. Ofav3-42]|uniref:hypothetical protein n=1 Tax=Ruegeria sp. Ofav3-42 TaxID=2917759 RepID=UPI001EF736F9|nr:hypothetical protein [Ruegeria sp. Ofav3-42]MCG7519429.1 hypothetical protein [Ruegeria sp. Ofav3-42]
MSDKSIEIIYSIADIPDITDRSAFSAQALDFRNAAMEHIESALTVANLGEWEGAEIGADEVSFGFSVYDFEQAEAAVRQAVSGTRYAGICEIVRCELSENDFGGIAVDAKPLGFFGMLSLLIFRRLPKRFRDN